MASPSDPAPAHAESFARAFPALADRLGGGGEDPDLERLVEGFGVLAARVERVIDATSHRSAAWFAELLSPELLRPFPCATILELTGAPSRRPAREAFAEGAEFDSVSVNGTRCRFRSHAPFTYVPWRVAEAKLGWSTTRGQSLDVGLAPIGTPRAGDSPLPLRLHFLGEPRSALLLLAWMHEHLTDVELDVNGRVTALGANAVRAWGFAREDALLPIEPLEHPGLRMLRELLVLPAKFTAIDVNALPIPALPAGGRVVLRFRFDTALPAGVRVDTDAIRTNCIPVVNAFATTADPLRPSLERPVHPLRPAGLRPDVAEVYAVREVVARRRDGQRLPVPPVTAFGAGAEESLGMRYALEREPSRAGSGADASLMIAGEDQDDSELDVFSLDLWATNRALPASLGIGDVRVPSPLSPRGLTFRNVRAVTPYRPALHGDALVWRVLALAALSAKTLANRDALRTLLHALDLHAPADAQAGRAHAQKLDAISEVDIKPAVDHLGGRTIRGHDVTVRLSESAFDGEGEAFLFGRVLASLFAHEASLNAFVRTTLVLAASGKRYRFSPLHGEMELA